MILREPMILTEGPLPAYRHGEFYIPDRMMEGLRDYMLYGHEPGSFLMAVLCNNLIDACGAADQENARNLPAYAAFIYNEAPTGCWGTRERVHAWMEQRRAWQAARQQQGGAEP